MLRLKPITRPVASYALAVAAVGVAYVMSRRLPLAEGPVVPAVGVIQLWSLVFVALSLIFLGFLMLIIRRDLFSQIIGFLTVENGISAFAVVALVLLVAGLFIGLMVTMFVAGGGWGYLAGMGLLLTSYGALVLYGHAYNHGWFDAQRNPQTSTSFKLSRSQ